MSMMEYTNEFNFAPQVSDTLLPITTTPVSDCSLDYFPDAGPADFSFRTPSITPSTFVNPCAGLDAYDIDALIASSVPAALDTVPSFNTTTLSNEPLPLDAVSDLHATGAYDASTAFDESITVNASTGLNTPTDFNQPTSFDLSPNFNACIPFDASMNFNTSIASNTTTAFIGPTTSAISQAPDLAVHPDLVLPSNQPMPPGTQSPQICSTRSIASKKHSPPPNRQNCTSSKMLHFEDGWDEYWIRSNIESVPQESITAEVRQTNSIYPNANASQSEDQYKGRRWSFERECNRIGWALAVLNPTIEGKPT
ncbi:Hypothetical protein D9617_30g011730 [Elsinoe fawcettii]|nr:Hypothetical protein D9617_30g011730 [Elsinoe fawcettii]